MVFASFEMTLTFKSLTISFISFDVMLTNVRFFLDNSSIFSTFISLPFLIIPTLSQILETSFKI